MPKRFLNARAKVAESSKPRPNAISVKMVFGELGHTAQFIEAEFFFQVGVDIIDDGINAVDASLFNRPADNLGIHDIFILLQTHQFMQMLSVNEAEYYCAEPGGSAVKIYVLTYKGRVCSSFARYFFSLEKSET